MILKIFVPRTRSKLVFILVMVCYTWTTTCLVGAAVRAFHITPPPVGLFATDRGEPTAKVTDLLFLAPLLESLILIIFCKISRTILIFALKTTTTVVDL